MVLELVAALIIYLITKNSFAAMLSAIVLCGGTMLFYGKNPSSFEGLFGDILKELSLFERFYDFVDGIFDVTSIVYFVAVSAVFLYLSVQSMEKRRWSE